MKERNCFIIILLATNHNSFDLWVQRSCYLVVRLNVRWAIASEATSRKKQVCAPEKTREMQGRKLIFTHKIYLCSKSERQRDLFRWRLSDVTLNKQQCFPSLLFSKKKKEKHKTFFLLFAYQSRTNLHLILRCFAWVSKSRAKKPQQSDYALAQVDYWMLQSLRGKNSRQNIAKTWIMLGTKELLLENYLFSIQKFFIVFHVS